ncbi:MAG: hypothetical protein HETSPECPRED_007396 [Heterodermia speciosa]|uniref:CobW/HypB/UreG nucleotide-binding domain-containing protein n=1 Tax=Heterodermia speciosa TaxID=116794 RepID=A0A8H3FRL0_9LECA|nr:MAG: hypothetical protein HETSPECPRED_007396 [Heterodermia speciosa]
MDSVIDEPPTLVENTTIDGDTGLASIEALISQRGGFDYILLETSGLADPGNLAPLFWTDDGLGSNTYLDGIVTVVDAKNILTSLSETPSHPEVEEAGDATEGQKTDEDHAGEHLTTAHLQISHADVIVLNKADTVTPEQLDAVHGRVTSINGLAKIHVTQHSRVPHLEGFLLDLHAYDGVKGLEEVEKKGHSHIDPSISTLALPIPILSPSQFAALESWLRLLLWENTLLPPLPSALADPGSPPFSIHRAKGLIRCQDGAVKMLQGVREVFDITDLEKEEEEGGEGGGGKEGKIVLIGRGLRRESLEASLGRALREVGD